MLWSIRGGFKEFDQISPCASAAFHLVDSLGDIAGNRPRQARPPRPGASQPGLPRGGREALLCRVWPRPAARGRSAARASGRCRREPVPRWPRRGENGRRGCFADSRGCRRRVMAVLTAPSSASSSATPPAERCAAASSASLGSIVIRAKAIWSRSARSRRGTATRRLPCGNRAPSASSRRIASRTGVIPAPRSLISPWIVTGWPGSSSPNRIMSLSRA